MLQALAAATPVFQVCKEALAGTEKHPGYDADRDFESPFGKLDARGLRDRCLSEKKRLDGEVVGLKWRARLEEARDRAQEAKTNLDTSGDGEAPARVKLAGEALGGFRECVERAEHLPKEPGADKKLTVVSPFGKVTAQALAKACSGQISPASKALDSALAAQKLADFLKTCKGDELEVAKREGMPTKVDAKGGGRIFAYGSGKKERRFAFDGAGKRVEEKLLK